jgi:hypothetical protein
LAVCYALILQAFFAAFETPVVLFQANASNGGQVISRNAYSTFPSSGDAGKREKLSCLLCAIAAASGAFLPDPVPAVFAPYALAGGVTFVNSVAILTHPPARDGCSRAPPSFA